MKPYNILIVGVGGQGILLASRVIGTAALKENYDVKVSEVHGMAQRGGSVVTHVKLAQKVYSPLIEKGEADLIISFEQLEAFRWAPYLRKEGTLIVNTQKINPMPVIIGNAQYPKEIIPKLKDHFSHVHDIDAFGISKQIGNTKAVNTVLLGVSAHFIDLQKESWYSTLQEVIPPAHLDMNIKAFESGYNHISTI